MICHIQDCHNEKLVTVYPLPQEGTKINLKNTPFGYQEKLSLKYNKIVSKMPLSHKYVPPVHLHFFIYIQQGESTDE